MVAGVTNLKVCELIHTIGDAHLYENHLDQAKDQLFRHPCASPQMIVSDPILDNLTREKKIIRTIFDYTYEDFCLLNYHNPWPHIAAEVAV